MSLADELEQIALDMERAVAGGMSWISHGEADNFVRRIRRALTERKAPGEVEGLVERLLNDLLAVIHRDGGHRQAEVGLEQAWMEAMMQVPFLLDAPAELASLKQQLAEREEALREAVAALRPFASHVGKSGSVVKLSIGDDTWTHSLTTEHFHRVSNVVRRALTRNTDGAARCNQGSAPENGDG